METIWRLEMLGRLAARQLDSDAEPITRFRTQKAAALLAYLAVHAGPQPREALMALLWPDAPIDAARNSLSVALSSLRHQMEPPGTPHGALLVADRQKIGLRPGALASDVDDFLAAARAARRPDVPPAERRSRLQRAVDLYGGPFLPGSYDDWTLAQREVLADAFRECAEALRERLPDDERPALLHAIAQRDPDTADTHTPGPSASERRGSQAPNNPSLAEGCEPKRAGCLRPECEPLPFYPTRFFGREREREQMTALLDAGARLVTLVGTGGLGKTRLAVEALRGHAGPVTLVPLAEQSDSAAILPAVRAALSLPPARDERAQLLAALAESPRILILDNLEQLGDTAADPVAALLDAAPALRLVATSRRPLNLPDERLLPLAPLPADPAVALFCDRARAALPDFQLTERNAAAVSQLCARLDGLPLAIELAASRARVLTPGQWLERLERGLDAMAGAHRTGVPERHRTLVATLRWSYDLLPPETRPFFCQLSVFRGGWDLAAAEAITGDPLALDQLATLCESSLVELDGTGRYRMFETVREFAASQGDEPPRARHADYFAQLAVPFARQLRRGSDGDAARAWFDAERENLRAALAWTAPPGLLPLAAAVGRFWEARGDYAEATTWLESALAADSGDRAARSAALLILGNIAHNRGALDRAETLLGQCLALRQADGDDQGAAMTLNNLSLVAAARQDFARARTLTEQAIAAHRRAGSEHDAAISQVNLANLHGYAGEWTAAERLYRDAVPALEARGDRRALASVFANLSACAAARDDLEQAEAFVRDSIAHQEAQGDRFGLAQSLDTLAEVLALRGRVDEARSTLRRGIQLLQEITAWRTLPIALLHLAGYDRQAAPVRAARLLGAIVRLQRDTDVAFPSTQSESVRELAAALRATLGDTAFDAAHAAGEALALPEIVALALEKTAAP